MATRPTPRRQLRSPTFRTPEVTPRFRDLTPRTDQGQTALAAQLQASQRIMQAQARAAADFDARMTGFINSTMRMAGKAAEIEGAEYGVQEAPDVSIIKDAYGNLTAKIEGDIVGDTFSIYGQAARKAALEQLSTKLEVAATIKLKEMVTGAIDPVTGRTMMTPTDLRTNMDSLVQNTVASAGQHSPMLAGVLGPKLTLTASTQFKSFNTKYLSERQQEYEATARAAGFEYLNTVQEMIRQGNLQPGLSDQMRKAAAERIIRAGGDPVQFLKDWETGVSEAKVDGFITAGAGFDAGNLLLDFHDYRIEKPWSDDLRKRWETLTSPERIEAIKALSTRATTQHAQEERDEDTIKEQKEKHLDHIVKLWAGASESERIQLRATLRSDFGDEGLKLADSLEKTDKSSPEDVDRLERLAALGTITYEDVSNADLNGTDYVKYFGAVATSRDQSPQFKAATAILRRSFRIPEYAILNPQEKDRAALLLYQTKLGQLTALLRDNAEVTINGLKQKLTNENVELYAAEMVTDKDKTDLRTDQLNDYSKRLGFKGTSPIGDYIESDDPMRALQDALAEQRRSWRNPTKFVPKIDDEDQRQEFINWINTYREALAEGFTLDQLRSGKLGAAQ